MDSFHTVSLQDGPPPAILAFDHSDGLQSQDDLYQAVKAARSAFVCQLLKLGCIGTDRIVTERRKRMHKALGYGATDMLTPHVEQCRVLLSSNRKPFIQWDHDLLLFGRESPHCRK